MIKWKKNPNGNLGVFVFVIEETSFRLQDYTLFCLAERKWLLNVTFLRLVDHLFELFLSKRKFKDEILYHISVKTNKMTKCYDFSARESVFF